MTVKSRSLTLGISCCDVRGVGAMAHWPTGGAQPALGALVLMKHQALAATPLFSLFTFGGGEGGRGRSGHTHQCHSGQCQRGGWGRAARIAATCPRCAPPLPSRRPVVLRPVAGCYETVRCWDGCRSPAGQARFGARGNGTWVNQNGARCSGGGSPGVVPRAGRAVQAAALMPGRSPLRSWVPPTPDPSTGDELVGLLLAAHGAPAGRLGHLHAVPRPYQHGARSPFISGRPARGRASIRIISSISGAMATRIARYPRPRQLRPSSEHCSPSATPNPLPGYARRMPRWLNGTGRSA